MRTVLLLLVVSALGCGTQVTFSKNIAPLLRAKCQSCHRPGQIAPMSLLTYQDVRPFAELIRLSVANGNMPPFYADGPPGYYKNDLRLSPEEKQLIHDWADAGAPEGDPADLPEPLVWDDSEWPLGEPDLIVGFPRHSPPPIGKDEFITFVTDYVLPEDVWARALHLKLESSKAVHHSSQFLWPPDMAVPEGGKTFDHASPFLNPLFTWVPGFETVPLPRGQAVRLPASHRVASMTHFAPTREDLSEEMRMGVYFADGEIDSIQQRLSVYSTSIRIPPGDSNWTTSEEKRFEEAGLVSHFNVHMHLRGKSSKIVFHYPDGSSETVFDLPRYRFEWQRYYYLAEPIFVPEGTTAEFIGVWDNSAGNPSNPDPTVWCNWGLRTIDEMFGAIVYYTPVEKLSTPLQIVNGRLVGGSSPELGSTPLL